jgi:actin-like ATPase involved in cell morphogenesis
MQGKKSPNITVIRPMKDGVIADFNAAEIMIRGMIKNDRQKKPYDIAITQSSDMYSIGLY